MLEPVDIDRCLADSGTYEDVILGIFTKRQQRGLAYADAGAGVTYFDTATNRRSLARALAGSVAAGDYQPLPVELWSLESKDKVRDAHLPSFTDHVVG